MYHAEKIIDGVLHWKGTPQGEWKPYNAERLTALLERERKENLKKIEALENELSRARQAKEILNKI